MWGHCRGTDPSDSEPPSRQTETDTRDDETNSPDHTDTDPYGDPTDSQADVEQEPDTEQVILVDSPDEAPVEGGPVINPEPPSTSQDSHATTEVAVDVLQETPPATTEAVSSTTPDIPPTVEVVPSMLQETPPATTTDVASGVLQEAPSFLADVAAMGAAQEATATKENTSKASASLRPMGRMDTFTRSEGDYFNPLKNPFKPASATPEKKQAPGNSQESQTAETLSQETTTEGTAPPAKLVKQHHLNHQKGCTGRRAKPGRFGSLAFAMKNRHFGGECSWILAGKARKCGRFWCLRVSRILVNKASGDSVL